MNVITGVTLVSYTKVTLASKCQACQRKSPPHCAVLLGGAQWGHEGLL